MTLARPWFFYFANSFLRLFFRIFARVQVRGIENVPRAGALIVAISHSSFFDPLLSGALIPREVIPMAKIEAFSVPVIGWWVKWYGAFPVRRGEADVSAFKTALQILRLGGAINIAPEGHRSETGALQRGREGAIILAHRGNAAILPVAVWGGRNFLQNFFRVRRTDMSLYLGEPVVATLSAKPSREELQQAADELMCRIAEMMPPEIQGYYADSRVQSNFLKPYRLHQSQTIPATKEVMPAV